MAAAQRAIERARRRAERQADEVAPVDDGGQVEGGAQPVGHVDEAVLDAQCERWDAAFEQRPDRFGTDPSVPAREAAALFAAEGRRGLLELGAGEGRDTLFFAASGFRVTALDYSRTAVRCLEAKARAAGLGELVTALRHDVREPLPAADSSVDACYSHMLYCMALTTPQLEALTTEVRRVLCPGGLLVYTARHVGDADAGAGVLRGEDMWESGGFIVHFFSRELVERLARGFELLDVAEFEEGPLPRRLYRVTMRVPGEPGE